MNIDKYNIIVKNRIKELVKEFSSYPEKFLTEEDLRAYLYHLLHNDLNIIIKGKDGSQSIPLHCEVRFYGETGRLKLRSDIVICNVSTLKTKNSLSFRLPTKGYSFDKPWIIIEIKLRRKNGKSDNKFIEIINGDRNKLQEIRKTFKSHFYSYLIIFDKKRNINCQNNSDDYHKEYYIYPYKR